MSGFLQGMMNKHSSRASISREAEDGRDGRGDSTTPAFKSLPPLNVQPPTTPATVRQMAPTGLLSPLKIFGQAKRLVSRSLGLVLALLLLVKNFWNCMEGIRKESQVCFAFGYGFLRWDVSCLLYSGCHVKTWTIRTTCNFKILSPIKGLVCTRLFMAPTVHKLVEWDYTFSHSEKSTRFSLTWDPTVGKLTVFSRNSRFSSRQFCLPSRRIASPTTRARSSASTKSWPEITWRLPSSGELQTESPPSSTQCYTARFYHRVRWDWGVHILSTTSSHFFLQIRFKIHL